VRVADAIIFLLGMGWSDRSADSDGKAVALRTLILLPPPVEVVPRACSSLVIFPTFRPAAQREYFTSLAAGGFDYPTPGKKMMHSCDKLGDFLAMFDFKIWDYLHRWIQINIIFRLAALDRFRE